MPRHARRSATRPWTLTPGDPEHTDHGIRLPGPLIAAVVGALVLSFVIPMLGPRGRADDPIAAPRLAAGAERTLVPVASPAPPVAPEPARPPDPGPDDVRSVADAPPHPWPASFLSGYVWPLPKGRLTQPFGHSPFGGGVVDGRPFHDGLDLATFCGDRIVAAHAGRVLAVGRRFDEWIGWRGSLERYQLRLTKKRLWGTLPIVVVIDDGNGYRSVYAHFSRTTVKRGQLVKAGQLIGYEGASGHASGCHLHYALFSPLERSTFSIRADVAKRLLLPRRQTARIDPLLVLPFRKDLDLD